MAPKTLLTTPQIQLLLKPLEGKLGKALAKQLENLLPLFSAGPAKLSDALLASDPDVDLENPVKRAAALKQLQLFATRFRAIAPKGGVPLSLRTDSLKRNQPADRTCWWEGAAPDDAAIDAFTEEAVGTVDSLPAIVPPTALILTREELENPHKPRRHLIRFFVSYAHADVDRVLRLQTPLEKELLLSKRYQFEVWHDRKIPVGANWDAEIKGALTDCHFGLLFVSRDFLLSNYITETELPALVAGKKPLVPVGLTVLDFGRVNLKGLEEKQFFRLTRPSEAPRFFAQCSGHIAEEFVQQLASSIEERVAALLEDGTLHPGAALRKPGRSTLEKPPAPIAVAKSDEDDVYDLEQCILDGTPLPDSPVPPEGFSTGLGQIEKDAILATANRTLAVDYLADWAADPSGTAFCAVLGEVGIGKTTALMMLAQELHERRKNDPTIPAVIFIDLKDYEIGAGDGLEEILACVIRRHWKGQAGRSLTPDAVLRAVRERGALLIFDGLDERIIPLPQAKREAFIRELWRALPPLAQAKKPGIRPGRLIISCRSHYFPSVTALCSAFTGELREGIRAKDYTACIILPFRDEQIRAYLRGVLCEETDSEAVCTERVEAAVKLIHSVHNLSEPATRPMLLSLIAPELAALERLRAEGKTVLGVTLYGLFVDKWLARDAGKHQFTPDHKIIMMQALAAHLLSQNQKTLPWSKISAWLDGFLNANAAIRDRYRNTPAEVLNQDFRAATMVLRPDSEKDGFRFAHSSLGEYFLALRLAHALEEGYRAALDLPLMSDETLDFLGQLLAEGEKVDSTRAVAGWSAMLDDPAAPPQARRAAFRAWLVARDKGWPQPAPAAVQLQGLDLEHWIVGSDTGPVLDLRGACLEKTCLDHSVLTRVLLTGARADGASARLAEFQDVTLTGSSWEDADFTGGIWRDCTGIGLQAATARWHDCDVVRCDLAGASLPSDWPLEAAVCLPADASTLGGTRLPVTLRQGHGGSVNCVAFSPDGKRLLSGSSDKSLKLWDAASGRCLLTLDGHSNGVMSVAFSPDGSLLLSGSYDNSLKLWDAASGRCLLTLAGHRSWISSVAFSPDGSRLLSGSYDKSIKLWDAISGRCLLTLDGHASSVTSVAFSPDGSRLLTGSDDDSIKLWGAASGRCLLTLDGHASSVNCVAFSPDGSRLLTGSGDDSLKLWDANSGRCLLTLEGHLDWVTSVAFSPDSSRLLSGSEDQSLKLWDAVSGRCLLTIEGHSSTVSCVAFSPDGSRLLSGSEDQSLKLWDAVSGRCLLFLEGHKIWVMNMAFSLDGSSLLSGSGDHSLKLWDAESGRPLIIFNGHSFAVTSVAFTPGGSRLLSGSHDRSLKLWDASSGRCLLTLVGHKKSVSSVALSPDGSRLLSGSHDRSLKLWDAASGRCLLTLNGHKTRVMSVAFAPDGLRLLSGSGDRSLKLWDAASGRCLVTLEGHSSEVISVVSSPDGSRLLSGSRDKSLKLWDAASGRCLLTLDGHSNVVMRVAFSPDGFLLLSGSRDNSLKLWDAVSGRCLLTLDGHSSAVMSVAFSPDGSRILSTGADATMREWDAATGQLLRTWLSMGDESALIDFPGNRIIHATPGAWRHLGWQGYDPTAQRQRLLPAEYYGPLPPWPAA